MNGPLGGILWPLFLLTTADAFPSVYVNTCRANSTNAFVRITHRCPYSGSLIWEEHMCDGFRNCPTSGLDEADCVTANDAQRPVQIYMPKYQCHAALCKAHTLLTPYILCRQIGALIYGTIAHVHNNHSVPALAASNLRRCTVRDPTIQHCLLRIHRPRLEVCPQLLAIDCLKQCLYNVKMNAGTVSSVGYGQYHVPNMNCTWHIEVSNGTMVQIEFLQIDTSLTCDAAYVELTLHNSSSTGQDVVVERVCNVTSLGKVFTSASNRTRVRHVLSPRAHIRTSHFLLRFSAAHLDNRSTNGLKGKPLGKAGVVAISIIAVFVIIFAFLFVLRQFVKLFYMKAVASRYNQHHQGRHVLALGSVLQAIATEGCTSADPLTCGICGTVARNMQQACEHIMNMAKFFENSTGQVFDAFEPEANVQVRDRNNNNLSVNYSTPSNATMDLDEMVAACSRQFRSNSKLHDSVQTESSLFTNVVESTGSQVSQLSANANGAQPFKRNKIKRYVGKTFNISREIFSPPFRRGGLASHRLNSADGLPSILLNSEHVDKARPNGQLKHNQPSIAISPSQSIAAEAWAGKKSNAMANRTISMLSLLRPKMRTCSSSSEPYRCVQSVSAKQWDQLSHRSISATSMLEGAIGPPVLNSTQQEDKNLFI